VLAEGCRLETAPRVGEDLEWKDTSAWRWGAMGNVYVPYLIWGTRGDRKLRFSGEGALRMPGSAGDEKDAGKDEWTSRQAGR